MPVIANSVFDAALGIVDNCNKAQVLTAASAVLIDSIALNASNFGAIGDNSGAGGGRKIQCLVSSSSDMKAISVTSAGDAKKIALLISAAVTVVASITSAVTLGASEQVNLGTFSVILKDPT
jgi:hypothetical protein